MFSVNPGQSLVLTSSTNPAGRQDLLIEIWRITDENPGVLDATIVGGSQYISAANTTPEAIRYQDIPYKIVGSRKEELPIVIIYPGNAPEVPPPDDPSELIVICDGGVMNYREQRKTVEAWHLPEDYRETLGHDVVY